MLKEQLRYHRSSFPSGHLLLDGVTTQLIWVSQTPSLLILMTGWGFGNCFVLTDSSNNREFFFSESLIINNSNIHGRDKSNIKEYFRKVI